ncbi:hypothetical protein ACTXT7_002301 [Hymenolepis weldensis]
MSGNAYFSLKGDKSEPSDDDSGFIFKKYENAENFLQYGGLPNGRVFVFLLRYTDRHTLAKHRLLRCPLIAIVPYLSLTRLNPYFDFNACMYPLR